MHSKFKLKWKIFFIIVYIQLLTKLNFCDAIVCYKCDSISLEACATTLNETDLPYENCKSLQCTMSIVDSVTYRGCSDSTPTSGATYKKSCSENLCNKGVYPPGRLKCYQCSGQQCNRVIGKPHPCPNHQEDDECYIDAIEIDQIYRGCRSNTNHTVSTRAIFCDYNGCNNAPASSKLKCAQCDSKLSRGCKRDLVHNHNITQYDTCEMDVKINVNSSCFIYHNMDRVLRGCSDLMPEEVKKNMNRTLMCSGPDFCNTGNLETQQCLQCNSERGDDNCRFDTTKVATTFCSSPEASSCYAVEYKNWHVERGCSVVPLNKTDKNREYECDIPKDCNRMPFTRCYKCSSEIDSNCAAWQRPGFLEIEECEIPAARCLVATFADGVTKRGCESQQLNCNHTSTAHCSLCEGSFCNRGPFPPERLHCYQCGSMANDCAAITKRDPLPCPLNDLEPTNMGVQACFEYFSKSMGHIVRGCASNGLEYYKCMLQQQPGCQLCNTNGCNKVLNEEE
ncbi:uncharacterized protein LOC119609175 [Lucilia sericata]|uniref:uncharacterized protein LOC119609175 n=1 Tax=Lucilia sericata TaxID=13632 RepID=UPI0018A834EB|nr:uncharacterized protein LOC119609175 [Lucilia sericata]